MFPWPLLWAHAGTVDYGGSVQETKKKGPGFQGHTPLILTPAPTTKFHLLQVLLSPDSTIDWWPKP